MPQTDYCNYMTGLPEREVNFLVSCVTNYEQVEFYSDGVVYVDWGDGKELKYDAGIIQGTQIQGSEYVVLSSDETITEFRFGYADVYDNNFYEIYIHKAKDLTTAKKMCYRLEELTTFNFDGTNNIGDFTDAWNGCTNLESFSGVYTANATSLARAWYNCASLKVFPEIHAPECTTVRAAWLGCTSMLFYGEMSFESCTNYANAWRGNISLTIFPLIDISAGQTFTHTWAYCTGLKYFPALDFSSGLDFDYMLAYCENLTTLPVFNTTSTDDKTFKSMFEQCTLLECIGGINTDNYTSTENIFLECPSLVNPNDSEQGQIEFGYDYENTNACYFDAGRSRFFVHSETTGDDCTFLVEGGNVEVDWGDGIYLHYSEGTITGVPIFSNSINIRSEEKITGVYFLSDTYESVELKRALDLTTCTNMCLNLTNLTFFQILGELRFARIFDNMLKGCTSLEAIDEVDLSYAQSIESICEGCSSLITLNDTSGLDRDISSCTVFTRAFFGCSAIETISTLHTPLGQQFGEMFSGCSSMKCLGGIDTREQIRTTDMFYGCDSLLRPNVNEIPDILAGELYNMEGPCESEFNMIFTGNGTEVQFELNRISYIDWGDGNVTEHPSGIITGTPTGTAYVSSSSTSLDFITDNFITVNIINGSGLLLMDELFKDKINITSFKISNAPLITTWAEAFSGATGLQTFSAENYEHAIDYTDMFRGTTSLTSVGCMNTLAGKYFEGMFQDTALTTLGEINTENGIFALNYIECNEPALDCSILMNCDLPMTCSLYYDCDTYIDCYGASTMFLDSAITSPDASMQKQIMSRYHYQSGGCQ